MAHYFGTSSDQQISSSNPATFSFTVSSDDTVLVLMFTARPLGIARIGGAPTYGGVQMTEADSLRSSLENDVETWYLLNPNPGTATISIPNTNAQNLIIIAATGRAASGRSILNTVNGNVQTSTNPSVSVTTTKNGAIIFAFIGTDADTWIPTGQDGISLHSGDHGISGSASQYLLQENAGAQAMGWIFGTSSQWAESVISFAEEETNPAVEVTNTMIY